MNNRAVFLDRDGIINQAIVREGKPYSPRALEEFIFAHHIEEHLRALSSLGFILIVVTNQPDIGRKLLSPAVLSLMHAKLQAVLPITHIYVCPHSDEDNCLCRKPKPGLIFQAAAEHHIDCENSYLVGDRWSDIEAGRQAGCKTLFIDYGYQEQPPLNPHHQSHSLSEGISWILGEK